MKKPKPIFILVFCSLIPLMFTATIPYVIPTKLHMNSSINNETGTSGSFVMYAITLEEGSQYTIDVDTSSFWGMHVSIRIAEAPYMISGVSVESGSSSGETMHFTALKTGDYYIQVKINSGGGFFDISVESGTIGSATGVNIEFFDILYLMVLILPSISIIALGLLILRRRASVPERKPTINIYKRVKREETDVLVNKENVLICEYCGTEINKYRKKCPNCHTSLQ
ncbi:MAG: hypothetical protein ACTSO6_10710 [Promethearchaeota archaeon]